MVDGTAMYCESVIPCHNCMLTYYVISCHCFFQNTSTYLTHPVLCHSTNGRKSAWFTLLHSLETQHSAQCDSLPKHLSQYVSLFAAAGQQSSHVTSGWFCGGSHDFPAAATSLGDSVPPAILHISCESSSTWKLKFPVCSVTAFFGSLPLLKLWKCLLP